MVTFLSNRRDKRSRSKHDVQVSFFRETDLEIHTKQCVSGRVVDYSLNGLCVESQHFVSPGDLLEAYEDSGGESGEFFHVRWVRAVNGLYRFGCRLMRG
jgi:hypothetical protein